VALAFIEETAQLVGYSYRAYCDAFGTPRIAIRGCEYGGGFKDIVKIVHRLSLTHENDVCKTIAFRKGVYLIQYIGDRQVALKALLACLTKQTVHLASHLARDTKRGTFSIRDEYGFYKLIVGF
jgi:hypothetical protein